MEKELEELGDLEDRWQVIARHLHPESRQWPPEMETKEEEWDR